MSLLRGVDIAAALRAPSFDERLVVTPFFEDSVQIEKSTVSINLRLGCRFSVAKARSMTHFAVDSPEDEGHKAAESYYVPLGGTFLLHPGRFVLGATLEWIRLPPHLGGYILSRSSYGRRGLIIATATGVHPLYSGVLTLELTNVAEVPLEISPGQPICQLFLHRTVPFEHESAESTSAFLGSLYPELGATKTDKISQYLKSLDPKSVKKGATRDVTR